MTSAPRILAIESSCDETAAAVARGSRIESSVVATQIETHRPFGGIVPELASRQHLTSVVPVVREALHRAGVSDLRDLDGLAVTEGPGLVGALLVGLQAARGLAVASGLPLFGIHHMEGHIFSAFLGDDELEPEPFRPHIALLVSGGHTELVDVHDLGNYELLGRTRDDAAGEAYDKVAKRLGLGYPGGPIIDKLAAEGEAGDLHFPRAMLDRGLEFSFSGLKTAVLTHLARAGEPKSRAELAAICAAFQEAVVEVLATKAVRALNARDRSDLHIVGGVAANRGLRTAVKDLADRHGFRVRVPPLRYCGDNAAMIAAAAAARQAAGCAPGTALHASGSITRATVVRSS